MECGIRKTAMVQNHSMREMSALADVFRKGRADALWQTQVL